MNSEKVREVQMGSALVGISLMTFLKVIFTFNCILAVLIGFELWWRDGED
jgi:hypothetical protein